MAARVISHYELEALLGEGETLAEMIRRGSRMLWPTSRRAAGAWQAASAPLTGRERRLDPQARGTM